METTGPIAVFGGTFDPPHLGHLIVASDVCDALGLDKLLFVPAARPPHKSAEAATAAGLRLAMVELAVTGDGRFGASDIEIAREGASYTIDTVRELKGLGYDEVFLVIGADSLLEIETWKDYPALLKEARVVAVNRPGFDVNPKRGPDLEPVTFVEVTSIGISSTMVRERVAGGRPIKYLVPAAVENFIRERGLYASDGL